MTKGLSYAISVFYAYAPEEGSAYMKRWMDHPHPKVHDILKSNLSKQRMKKADPQRWEELLALMQEQH